MSAPCLDVDREAVRVLAVAVGVREAARRMGLKPATVCAWSRRFGWLAHTRAVLPVSMRPIASNARTSAADALGESMAEMGTMARLGTARAVAHAARAAERLRPAEAFAQIGGIATLAKAVNATHGSPDAAAMAPKIVIGYYSGNGGAVAVDAVET